MKKFFISGVVLVLALFTVSMQAATLLVANVLSNSVSLIDETSLKLIRDVPVGSHPHEVAVTPDGKFALVSNFGTVTPVIPGHSITVIDVQHAEAIRTINLPAGSRPHGFWFLSDTQVLVTAQGIQSLLLIDFTTGEILQQIGLPGAGAHMVTTDADHHYAYVVNDDSGSVCKVDLTQFSVVGDVKVGEGTEGLALTPNADLLLVASRKSNTVTAINTADLSIIKQINTEKGPTRIALFNGAHLALVTNTEAGTAQIIQIPSFLIMKGFKTTTSHSLTHGNVLGGILPVPGTITVLPNDYMAYVTHLFAGNITLVNLIAGKIEKTFEAGCEPDGMARSPVDVQA